MPLDAVPLGTVPGGLYLCGVDAVGPDPAVILEHLDAETVVCLQTDVEIERRYPDYRVWLADPAPYEALHLPMENQHVAADGPMASLIDAVVARLQRGESVVVHCGAGWGRAGLVGALVLVALGSDPDRAVQVIRSARPAAGRHSVAQTRQLERLTTVVRDHVALG